MLKWVFEKLDGGVAWISVAACARARIALLIQHATRLRNVLLLFVASLAPQRFSTVCHKRHDFGKEVIEHKMCVLNFCTTFM